VTWRWATWLLILAGWTLIAVVFAVSSSLTLMLTYRPPEWGRTFASAAADWYPWAALTPLVMSLARRLRLRRGRWAARFTLLLVAGFVIAFVKLTLTQVLRSKSGVAEYIAITNFTTQYLIFWGLVAVTHAVEQYQDGRARERRASQLEASLADARLQLLKMQLQPHFLFNTLNTIAELVHENPVEADRMIAGLSALLRESLEGGLSDLVPLEKELSMLERYVSIQRVRFGDRLDVRVAAEGDALRALVPSLVLQPLVENAIKYGLAARVDAGRIDVRAERRGSSLVLEIQDDGRGFQADIAREGVGLRNTRARLTELFGSDQSVDIESADGTGTRVRLTLPYHLAPATPPEAR
jgi:two-component system LytT family sensor kinase